MNKFEPGYGLKTLAQNDKIEHANDFTQFANILDNISDCFYALDENWRVIYVNNRAEEYFGIDRNELIGKNLWEAFPASANSVFAAKYREALAKQESVRFETQSVIMPEKWLEVVASPSPAGLIVYFHDITSRHKNAEKLAESENKLRLVINSVPVLICYVDADYRYRFVNRTYTEWFGHRQEEIIGKHLRDVMGETAFEAILPSVDRALAGETFSIERFLPYKDGGARYVSINYVPDRAEDNSVKGYYALVQDITDQKSAETKLSESEKRYRTLFNSIDEGFCVFEMIFDADDNPIDYRFLEVNPMFEKQTGLINAVGKTVRELLPKLEPHWFEIYGEVAKSGESKRFVSYSDTMKQWFDVYAFRVGGKTSRRVALVFNDITARKNVEIERERFFSISSDFQVITASNGYFKWVSPTCEKSLGWSADEMTAQPWTYFVHPDDIARSVDESQIMFTGRETTAFENRYRHKDGSYRWLLWNARQYVGEDIVYGVAIDITKLKEAEHKLQKSEAEFCTVTSAAPALVWVCAGSGELVFMNKRWYEFTGQTVDEAKGIGWTDTVHPDDAAQILPYWQRCQETGETYEGEIRYRRRDGEFRWHSFRALPRYGTDGKIENWYGISVDIDDAKRADQLLRESEERLRLATEAARIFSWELNLLNNRATYSTNVREVLGFELPSAVKTSYEFIHPDDRAQTIANFTDGIVGKKSLTGEYRFVNPMTGEVIWAFTQGVVLRDETGRPQRALGITQNITERKNVEIALRESEERFRNMADNAPMMVWVTEASGYCTYLSKSWYEFTGQTPETGLGFGWIDATHPDDHQRAHDVFFAANKTHEGFRLDYRLRRKDGEYRWAIDSAHPRFSTTGEFLGYIGSVIDITDRKIAEAERERLLAREHELRLQAEQANRLKDEFLATVSHELRTPLNAIMGWSTIVRQNEFDPTTMQRAFEVIERNARNQNQIIEDILDVSRIITGKLHLQMTSVSLINVINAAVETVRPTLEIKRIKLDTDFDAEAQLVKGDANRLQQIVWNLLTNAVKFTPPEGSVTIALGKKQDHAEIVVSDTGQGIESEFLPFVFERFRQEEGGSNRRHGGLGLGLAIVRHLVETHGGTVSVSSRGKNRGSSFTVRLPLENVLSESNSPPSNKSVSDTDSNSIQIEKTFNFADLRILLVDDEPDSLEIIAAILRKHNAAIETAESAQIALDKLQHNVFDLIVSDIGMPEIDGYELISRIRQNRASRKQIPAIALTAYARAEDGKRAVEAGYDRHLAKPVEPNILLQAIAELNTQAK